MNFSVFVVLLFGLQCIYWLIGRLSSKNSKAQKEDYFLAGKNVGLFSLMMTFLGTQVGGGLVLGAADAAFHFGWPVLLYPLGAALGLILLGAGIGRRLAEFQISTTAQIFEVVYQSTLLRKIASILSVISLFMILVAQIIASQKFLVSIGFSNVPLFILFWAIVIIYTSQGGLRAVISTDLAQAGFFSIIFLLCFCFAFPSAPPLPMPPLESMIPISSKLCGWLLMPLLFMVIEQDMGQRCFAGSSPRIVSKASLLAGICTIIICFVPVFFGCLANTMGLQIPQGSSILMAAIIKTTNPWMSAFVGCAILAAIISTATSLINAISSNISNDLKLSFLERTDSIRYIKGITCIISVAAIFFAFYFDNIVDILIQSYELSVSCLFVPIFIGLFKKRGGFISAWLAVLFGAAGFLLFRIHPIEIPKEIISILMSLFGYGCGSIFACFQTKIIDRAA